MPLDEEILEVLPRWLMIKYHFLGDKWIGNFLNARDVYIYGANLFWLGMLTDVRVVASELVFEKLHTSLKLYTSTSDPHHHSITQNRVLYY